MIPEAIFNEEADTITSCFFFTPDNKKLPLPIISNKYHINIKNNYAEIKSVQLYRNPFSKPL
jgi:hypothetical protein